MLRFEWDPNKDASNRRKHGVSFEEASSIFSDPRAISTFDEEHSTPSEDRFLTVGRSERARVLVVVHEDRDQDLYRIITARDATRRERKQYEELS